MKSQYLESVIFLLIGAAFLWRFVWIAFHWRATCRDIDKRASRKYRAFGFPALFGARNQANNWFTPVAVVVGMLALFGVGVGFCAAALPRLFGGLSDFYGDNLRFLTRPETIKHLIERVVGFLLGAVGLGGFTWIVGHWRATCRFIDKHQTRQHSQQGHSKLYIEFYNTLTPVFLLVFLPLLFGVSIALLTGLLPITFSGYNQAVRHKP